MFSCLLWYMALQQVTKFFIDILVAAHNSYVNNNRSMVCTRVTYQLL